MDARKLLRPLVRLVHPDLNTDAPTSYREINARSLAQIHSLIDALDSESLPGRLSDDYKLAFYIRTEPGKWRHVDTRLAFPSSVIHAQGAAASDAFSDHVEKELKNLLRAAGILNVSENLSEGKSVPKNKFRGSTRVGKSSVSKSPPLRRTEGSAAEIIMTDNLHKDVLKAMQRRQSMLPAANRFLDFVYGTVSMTDVHGERHLHERRGGLANAMAPDETEAAGRLSTFFGSGQLLVGRDLEMAEGVRALRKLGNALLAHHRALHLHHPVRAAFEPNDLN